MKLRKDFQLLLWVILGGLIIFSFGCVMMTKKKLGKVIYGAMVYGYVQAQTECKEGDFNKALDKMIQDDTEK
ncbi:unnamed protein product [marine sediment metagenome]|uniref:Lipoprotein n=1 Tax=marine sediment metagenome TaxID=412755 RepID=X0V186_9ZZZZ